MTLKFSGLKNNINLIRYLLVIFSFEKKNINDNAWITIIGEKYCSNALLLNLFFIFTLNVHSEVIKDIIK